MREDKPVKINMPRKGIVRESTVEDYLIERVKETGGETRKMQFIGRNGCPDRLVLYPNRAAWAELKASDVEEAETDQRKVHRLFRDSGYSVWVINSKHRVDAFLRQEFGV